MMKNLFEQDALARQHALDPKRSFIVQAPAGSGKTEFLIRRYLVLLTRVQFPEAVIAITFTRKAAAEMRLRILNALEMALHPCTSANDAVRWQLAKKVLAHDHAQQWNLLANPNRLRIQTIDSFCQIITRQMPLLSDFTEQSPIENPEFLYRLASQELINSLEDSSDWQHALLHLLKHLDNDFYRLETLFSELLACREQWLVYLTHEPARLRLQLEKNLQRINQHLLTQLNQCIPVHLLHELTELLHFSLQQRREKPIQKPSDRDFWLAASFFLLTKDNAWRQDLNQTIGFPSATKQKNQQQKVYYATMKQRAKDLIQCLQQQTSLHDALINLKHAPPLVYQDTQWHTLQALIELLPALLAHLKLIFQQYKKVDYTEILLCALNALGDRDKPSDLALHLDYQIEHLLVDEFQDTSLTQFRLIEKLISGWQVDDGRSLFLVGDPMQSIYRFRKAEVGLFLRVRQQGIGHIPLHTLTLSVNFRSDPDVIDWINRNFNRLLPQQESIHYGAIPFSPAVAACKNPQASVKPAITMVCYHMSHTAAEAQQIIAIIRKIKQQDPCASIAILVRARTHLFDLLPALQTAAIPYHAIEIESLSEQAVIHDLLALTRALLHQGDRIAWLALLRAPFCGLDLSDLHVITHCTSTNHCVTIWQQLMQFEASELKASTKQRLRRIVPILQQSLAEQARLPLTTWIKKTWLALGGPTTLGTPAEMVYVHTYLDYLEKKRLLEGDFLDMITLEEELSKRVTQHPHPCMDHVEIMTIHKAKGLEFDHVILPKLHRKANTDSPKLLLHQEQLLTPDTSDFLLAPLKASDQTEDAIYNYLALIEKQKAHHELTRLLYVASTRAKKSLSLLGSVALDHEGNLKPPSSGSLLQYVWPEMAACCQERLQQENNSQPTQQLTSRLIKRLPPDWQNPFYPIPEFNTDSSSSQFTYHWTLNTARLIGTVIHRLLYQISQDGLETWDKKDLTKENTCFIRLLEQADVNPSQLNTALSNVKKALENTLQDPRGRWILSQKHSDAHSELALTMLDNGKPHHLIIDRTFIDAYSGIRWIIDYKTTHHSGDNTDMFLNSAKQHHRQQLETYAAVFAQREKNPIQLALYFPLDTLWCSWKYSKAVSKLPVPAL